MTESDFANPLRTNPMGGDYGGADANDTRPNSPMHTQNSAIMRGYELFSASHRHAYALTIKNT